MVDCEFHHSFDEFLSNQPDWIKDLVPVNKIHNLDKAYLPGEIMDIHGERDSPNEGLLVVSHG